MLTVDTPIVLCIEDVDGMIIIGCFFMSFFGGGGGINSVFEASSVFIVMLGFTGCSPS